MTPAEVAHVIAYIDARLGRTTQRNPLQVEAWYEDLRAYPYPDAREAAHTLTSQPGLFSVTVGDLLSAIRKLRRTRLDRVALEPVPDADPNDVPAYLAALRNQRQTLSDPTPTTKEITA
jgi:hypothetical protein